ncbi:MAG: prefoldin subunit beta [Candidatus Woesearchaeota archaeon]
MEKETEQKIVQLQMIEQNMQNYLMQKQNFQGQLLEVENALKELETAKGKAYKIVGNVMVAADNAKLKKELNGKKDLLDLRIKSVSKQESALKEKAESLQKSLMEELKPKK